MNRVKGNRGSILFITLILLAVVGLWVGVAVVTSGLERKMSNRFYERQQALVRANSALEMGELAVKRGDSRAEGNHYQVRLYARETCAEIYEVWGTGSFAGVKAQVMSRYVQPLSADGCPRVSTVARREFWREAAVP